MTSSLTFESVPIGRLNVSLHNARTHPKKQIKQITASIQAFGFTNPILADPDGTLIAGHGRLEAARGLGMTALPTVIISGLSEAEKRKLMIADNKIALNAGWDSELLAIELGELSLLDDFEPEVIGFSAAEVDKLILDFEESVSDPADAVVEPVEKAVSVQGDLWLLGKHRLLCGDSRNPEDFQWVLGGDVAAMAFLDPPYNVKIASVVGRGKIKHDEFLMASGEMSSAEFRESLTKWLSLAALHSSAGAVHFVCIDWRHIDDLYAVGREVYGEVLNLAVWVKSNAGQGSFYRSQHELIGVFRVANGAYRNNIEQGRHGRNRSNVWNYAGVNTFGNARLKELAAHPTVKPVALIVDAIKDVSRRGDIVLDCFGGSGSTLLACERTGRKGRLIELVPKYVDVTIRRFQELTGKDAIHNETGATFDELLDRRKTDD